MTMLAIRVIILSMMAASIQIGARVYLKLAISGYPGCVASFDRLGRALVDWSEDMPEIGRLTAHDLDSLVLDNGFCASQRGFDFNLLAA